MPTSHSISPAKAGYRPKGAFLPSVTQSSWEPYSVIVTMHELKDSSHHYIIEVFFFPFLILDPGYHLPCFSRVVGSGLEVTQAWPVSSVPQVMRDLGKPVFLSVK